MFLALFVILRVCSPLVAAVVIMEKEIKEIKKSVRVECAIHCQFLVYFSSHILCQFISACLKLL